MGGNALMTFSFKHGNGKIIVKEFTSPKKAREWFKQQDGFTDWWAGNSEGYP